MNAVGIDVSKGKQMVAAPARSAKLLPSHLKFRILPVVSIS